MEGGESAMSFVCLPVHRVESTRRMVCNVMPSGACLRRCAAAVGIVGSILTASGNGMIGAEASSPPVQLSSTSIVKQYDEKLNKALFEEAWGAVYTMFYDNSAGDRFSAEDWRAERRRVYSHSSEVFSSRERTYDAIRDVVSAIGDPYTRFLTADEFQAERGSRSASTLNNAGVGLQLSDPFDGVEDLQVIAPLPESPAEEAGILPGDYLVAIDSIDVAYSHMTPDEAVAILRGPEGSKVDLDVLGRSGTDHHRVVVKRRPLKMAPIRSEIVVTDQGRYGYIRVHFFIGSAREAMLKDMREMIASGVDGLIIDVRNCLGGVFQEALVISSMFLDRPDAVLALTLDGNGIEREHIVENQRDGVNGYVAPFLPMAVLVNGGSASSSEVLATALQENGRALLVGERTFGKGLIQHSFRLRDGSAVMMTVAEYITPKHHQHVHNQGIEPDLMCKGAPTKHAADDVCVKRARQALIERQREKILGGSHGSISL